MVLDLYSLKRKIKLLKELKYYITIISLFISFLLLGQEKNIDSLAVEYYLIEGDTVPHTSIKLDEVLVLNKLKFDSDIDRRRYLILRRKTRKVWPYATLAAERLKELNERLDSMQTKRERRKYTRIIQRYVEDEFTEELKKLTRTEGQILIKLLHRQTGITAFELVKEYRSGWKAFWLNTTASFFDISMKQEYDPMQVKEDYLIEDILQRSFQANVLKRQPSALNFDFWKVNAKWTATSKTGVK